MVALPGFQLAGHTSPCSSVCPTELISFSENMSKFRELDTAVLGISTDSHFTHLAWTRTARTEGGVGKLDFPLLADISKDISHSYGVLV